MSASSGAVLAALVAALLGGCAAPGPTTSDGPSSTTLPPVPSQRASPTPPVGIKLHALDPTYVPDLLRSSHGQVLWAATHGELWHDVPGSAVPERLYASADNDATITAVAASAGGYTLVERSSKEKGEGDWRLWYLSAAGAQPVEIDRGNARNAGHPPTLAMDDSRVAWAGFDEPKTGWVSFLRVASLSDLGHPTTLLSFSINDALLWYPCLHGNELWYAIIHPDFDDTGRGNEFHIEMLDLAHPQAPPVRFAGVGHDFNPVVNDDFIAWKTAEGDSAALNWGTIHVQERGTQAVETVPVPNGNRPSIGDRYVTFDEISNSHLEIYDPRTRRVIDLTPTAPGAATYGGLSVSGDLLTWFTQGPDGAGLPRIGWATLPE